MIDVEQNINGTPVIARSMGDGDIGVITAWPNSNLIGSAVTRYGDALVIVGACNGRSYPSFFVSTPATGLVGDDNPNEQGWMVQKLNREGDYLSLSVPEGANTLESILEEVPCPLARAAWMHNFLNSTSESTGPSYNGMPSSMTQPFHSQNIYGVTESSCRGDILAQVVHFGFSWSETPEGVHYWNDVHQWFKSEQTEEFPNYPMR
jgi:hypothetical protein